MRSLELELEGFTSFRSRQNLDFSNLDLFAITGPTGAGKTSLLDAITFALYGHVARFGKDAKASELASQGKDNLKVSFRFSVRGIEYRVTRTWRKRPKTDKSDVFLETLNNGRWEKLETKDRGVSDRVEQILGMDFDTFTRVILLPQGKFDEFIKGNKTKRREILRDLAGFEIFEKMRKQANEKATIVKKEYEFLERQLADLQLPSEVEFSEKEGELTTIEQQLPILNEEVLKIQKVLEQAEELFKNITRLASLQVELSQLNIKASDVSTLKLRLQEAQVADQIKDNYALVKSARDRDKQAQSRFLSAQQRLTQAKQQLEKQKAKLDEVIADQQIREPQLKAREEALNSAKNYDEQRQQHQIELVRIKDNQVQRKNNLDLAAQAFKDAQNSLEEATGQLQDAEVVLQEYLPGGMRLKQLKQVSPLLVNWKLLEEQTRKNQQKLEESNSQKQKAEKTYQNAVAKLEQAKLQLNKQEKLLQEAEQANQIVNQNNHASALRKILHDGDNCPVCNGTYRTETLLSLPESTLIDTTELSQQKATLEQAEKAAEKDVTTAETIVANFQAKELEYTQDLVSNQADLDELQQQISTLVQTEFWEVNALKQELQALEESDTKYHETLAQQKDATALARETQQALESTQKAHITALSEYQSATKEVERWEQKLQQIEIKLNQITGGKSYKILQAKLEKENLILQEQLQEANKTYETVNKNLIQRATENEEASKSAEEARIQKEQSQTTWEVALVSAGFTEESFLLSQAEPQQKDSWNQEIQDYTNTKIRLETQFNEVQSLIGTGTTDESTINSLSSAKIDRKQKHQQAQNQRADLKAWIQNAESKRKESEKLEAKLSSVKQQAETYSILARNLKNDEFQAYILEHLEIELVTRATNVLQELTDSRYSLKILDGDYYVEDNWNGGESRRVQTLSGGETFATSLSMALALSEKLSMGAELGSLFLDEGFGTLDAETLETIYHILESLRQQDRLIGVITHVKALGERLPQVKVSKSPEGSRIQVEVF
jgi:exonuclease SbcC